MADKTNALARLQAELEAALARERASQESRRALLAMLEDLEESQREVERARREWLSAMDAVQDPIFMHDREYRVIRANRAYAERASMDVRQVVGKPYWQLFPKLDGPHPGCVYALEHRQCNEEEVRLPSGEAFLCRYYPILDGEGNYLYSLHIMQDVTEKRRAEAEQRTLSEALRQVAEAVLVLDAEGNIQYLNPAFYRLFKYAPEEILGRPISMLAVPEQDPSRQPTAVLAQLREHGRWHGEVRRLAKDGAAIPVLLSASTIRDARGAITGFVGTYLDLREIRQAEESLRESELRFRNLVEASSDWVWEVDAHGIYTYASPKVLDILGYKPDEVVGKTPFDLMPPEEAERIRADFLRLATEKRPILLLENVNRHKDGRLVVLETSGVPILDAEGALRGYRGMDRDITERKQAEMALQRALRAQRALSACNAILVHTTEEKQLLAEMCRAVVEQGGYRLAWIGFVEHDEGKSVRPAASAGFDEGYIDTLNITWGDSERGQGPTGRAVQLGTPQVAEDILADPQYAPWREQALQRGYASSIALPLKDGEVFGVLNIYAAEAHAFDEAEIRLLQELADDLSFGVLTLRMRRERDHYQLEHLKSAERLKEALIGTIRAIALTVEKRDPYTAGHQTRVADLAAAIALELGLDADR
ncbi:MAG: PAS domain S-box protein, partial [Sulfuricella sp.]|nr:PAS domain S-box protein [Sulfuricella sp.]